MSCRLRITVLDYTVKETLCANPTHEGHLTQYSMATWAASHVCKPSMFIVRGKFAGSQEWSKWVEWFDELWSSSLPHPQEKSLDIQPTPWISFLVRNFQLTAHCRGSKEGPPLQTWNRKRFVNVLWKRRIIRVQRSARIVPPLNTTICRCKSGRWGSTSVALKKLVIRSANMHVYSKLWIFNDS